MHEERGSSMKGKWDTRLVSVIAGLALVVSLAPATLFATAGTDTDEQPVVSAATVADESQESIVSEDAAALSESGQADEESISPNAFGTVEESPAPAKAPKKADGVNPSTPTTSSDLGNFTTGATIDGENSATYVVKPGKEYTVGVSFEEGQRYQFSMDGDLSYTLPSGINPVNHTDTVDITVSYTDDSGATQKVTVFGNSYTVDENGKVDFKWNTSDPGYDKLKESNNVEFTLDFKGTFSNDASQLDFGNAIIKTVSVDDSHSVSAEKTGFFQGSDGKAHYTVTVTSNGSNEDIEVVDSITGTALTYDGNVSASPQTGSATNNGNGFTYTIPSMKDGEKIELTYTATIDFDKLTGNGTSDETSNAVTVSAKDTPSTPPRND